MESSVMKALKMERRQKAMDSLFAKLEKTTLTILEFMDVQKTKYEEKHKIAIQRPCKEQC